MRSREARFGSDPVRLVELHERLTIVEVTANHARAAVEAMARALGPEAVIVTTADLQACLSATSLLPAFRLPVTALRLPRPAVGLAQPPLGRSLADELVDPTRPVPEVDGDSDSDSGDGQTELDAAEARLARAIDAVESARRASGPEMLLPDARLAIEAAHDEILGYDGGGKLKASPKNRRRREQARATLIELLTRFGFTTYEDYVLTGASAAVDSGTRLRLRDAVDELEAAQRWYVEAMERCSARRHEAEAAAEASVLAALTLTQADSEPAPHGSARDDVGPINLAESHDEARAFFQSIITGRPMIVDHALQALPSAIIKPILDWIADTATSEIVVITEQPAVTIWARRIDPGTGAWSPDPQRSARNPTPMVVDATSEPSRC